MISSVVGLVFIEDVILHDLVVDKEQFLQFVTEHNLDIPILGARFFKLSEQIFIGGHQSLKINL